MENFKSQLLKEFENMDRIPIFEINLKEYKDLKEDEYYIFNIIADINGLHTDEVTVEWDEYFSFYEHLSCMYDKCLRWAIEDFEKSLEV